MTATTHHRISVLVVEDSADHRVLMERQLRKAGIDVSTAATGEEALEQLAEVDLVLLDQGLPRMSGLDTLRAIRRAGKGPSVVMVTGVGTQDLAVEAMREGAIDFLAKNPGYLQALPNVIQRAWRQHDLALRAAELQRLALLINSAQGRVAVVREIVVGAQRLLRAGGCALCTAADGGLRVEQQSGDTGDALPALLARPRSALPAPGQVAVIGPTDLAVALPAEDGEPFGVLAVFDRSGGEPLEGELELAQAFASFAAVALRNLRRRELEETLVAELQQTIEARRDFVASVSHELRTPLTSISGFTETVLERWEALPDDVKQDLLGRVRRHTSELQRLVEQLIDIAGLERGRTFRVELERVNLASAVARSVDELAYILDGRALHVDVPEIHVSADPALLHRTMANLVSNAVKFSPPGTEIRITAVVQPDRVQVAVRDFGIGLAPREAARVFDPFWRAGGSVANAVRGSGIGLALVREYVRSMGGEIDVESEPDVGSTFAFTLQLRDDGMADAGRDAGDE